MSCSDYILLTKVIHNGKNSILQFTYEIKFYIEKGWGFLFSLGYFCIF